MANLYNLENEVNSALRLDGPLPSQQIRYSHLSAKHDLMNAASDSSLMMSSKTPNKDRKVINTSTPCGKRTPGSTGRNKMSGGRGSRTPGSADRFIPNRSATQFELAHFMLCNQTKQSQEEVAAMSPSQQEYKRVMNENLNGDLLQSRILSFKEQPPQTTDNNASNMRVLYSTSKVQSKKKTTRYIPQVPERILDAPDIMDDFYLRLIDWSKTGMLAVALGNAVYLWNSSDGSIASLVEYEGDDYISCVNWTADGLHLALGLSTGCVELWDTSQEKKVRSMTGHVARVASLSWNSYVLSSGSRSGAIHQHDVRVANHHVGTLQGHSQEVCGLQWSPSGNYLASGGNDNLVNIWRAGTGSVLTEPRPVYTFTQHQAAVKAISWCPWQRNVLASGGGTADRKICLWNCNNGASLQCVDTKSQVSALLWSEEHRELLSAHGFSQNQLTLWKYPALTKVAELTGHTSRILHACLSPDGTTVVSAGADETLRLWKCFQIDEKIKKDKVIAAQKEESSSLRFHMR